MPGKPEKTGSGAARRPFLIALVALVDVLIIFDAFAVAYLLRFRFLFLAHEYLDPAPVDEYVKAMVVVAYFWILLFYVFGLYDFSRHRAGIDTIHLVVKAVSFGTLIILSLTYFYRDFSFSRLVCVYAWAISILLFSMYRLSLNLFRAEWYRGGHDLRSVVIVGSKSLARFLIGKTQTHPELGYRVLGVVDCVAPEESTGEDDIVYLGNISELEGLIKRESVDGVLIAHPTLGHFDLLEVIQTCEKTGIGIRMVPPTYDLLVNYRDFEELGGLPLVKINEQQYRHLDDFFKRIFDLVAAALLLLITLPLWLLIALFTKIEDGGPVFFRQIRVGKDNRGFSMWKFRTMVPDAETRRDEIVDIDKLEEPVYKLENDPRVTRTGKVLRRTSLDELPQLLNVLLGEMSLVGPRPEEEKLVGLYNVWERRRLKALPGITGLQQVQCRGNPSLSERVKWDILYLRKRSTLFDAWILVKTVWVVLGGKGAR